MTEMQQFWACFLLFIGFVVLMATGDYITGLLALGMIFALLMVRTIARRK